MSESKHTPGPWHVSQRWAGYTGAEIRAGDASIADLRINGINAQHGEANARLIAAAPDLLAALARLVECPDVSLDELEPETVEACEQAHAAIAKARGGDA